MSIEVRTAESPEQRATRLRWMAEEMARCTTKKERERIAGSFDHVGVWGPQKPFVDNVCGVVGCELPVVAGQAYGLRNIDDLGQAVAVYGCRKHPV